MSEEPRRAGAVLTPVFVVGTPKSGTTLLMRLFDGHPAVVVLEETQVYHLAALANRSLIGSYARLRQIWPARYTHVHPRIALETALSAIEAQSTRKRSRPNGGALLRALVSSASHDRPSATHFLEKTPHHYRYVRAITRDFPTARFVHVIRDPRDNYVSLRRRMHDPASEQSDRLGYHPLAFLNNRILASLVFAGWNSRRTQREGTYRVVFFEDLVADPQQVVQGLCRWLEVPWTDSLLLPTQQGKPWAGNSFSPDLKGSLKPFDSRPIGRWRGAVSEGELVVLDAIAERSGLGAKYSPTESRSWWAVLRAVLRPFPGEVERGLRRRFWPIQLPIRYAASRVAFCFLFLALGLHSHSLEVTARASDGP